MEILIFGGTTEGRILAGELARRGHGVTVSVATALGAEELTGIPCTIWQGRMDEQEMAARIQGFDLVVDATHPYAEVVSRYIRAACNEVGVPTRRVLREASAMDDCIRVGSCKEAAEHLGSRAGNILVATGSKALRDYASLVPGRLYPRVLPTHEALDICEEMGIPHRNILAMQGPFTLEMNVAMLRQYDIAYLVTKDGGKAGGFEEKWQATRQTGAQLILVGRPADDGASMEELLQELEDRASCDAV